MKSTFQKKRTFRRRRATLAKRKPFYKTVRRIVNKVNSKNTEVKRYMSSGLEQTMSTATAGVNWLQLGSAISRGTGSDNRVGDSIKIIGIKFDIYLHNNTTTPTWVRHCLIRPSDKAVLDASSLIFMGTSNQTTNLSTLTGMASMLRKFHPNTVSKVYKDRVLKLVGTSATDGNFYRKISFFQKFGRGIRLTYNASSTGAVNTEPNLAWGIWSAEAPEDTISGSTIEYSYQYTIFYTDA